MSDSSALSGQLAAVDLGSNSFHLIVAQVTDGRLTIIDRLRETVRLAAGLDQHTKVLAEQDMRRGLECLERFAQRLRDIPAHMVRVVGTNTLRSARNGEDFRGRAESALGHRIEVIAGREEARLIYLGVAHGASSIERRRLVVDIGGGSTEFIIGEASEPLQMESLYMGCVSMNRQYFGDGRISKSAFAAAILAARHELEPIENSFSADHWDSAIGCSGTIKSIAAVCRAQDWCDHTLTRKALGELRLALLDAGHEDRIDLKELRADRRPVLAGGLAVLMAAFDALQIEQMSVSELALREGLLYDLLGRIRHEDVRGRSVRDVALRYSVDVEQGARVERTALACLRQTQGPWALNIDAHADMLAWAAQLHEVGLAISHNQYHKHGAYVLSNSDLPGFSRQEQALLGAFVRGHRRKFPLGEFDKLPAEDVITARRQCVLLRLAVALRRSRSAIQLPRFRVKATGNRIQLRFPQQWLEAHPLTQADLEEEARYLTDAGFELDFD
ncbi:MAG: exopolyphosphatase/guanosine-5'-triphosphate,3'-diphosphate pyrophosphatase [Gammaproteobacteria bacterium]|jgi:exopolyphosphatase/guanosine-5'-triphosphate,3'-diphosphate pyrophosphatase